MEKKKPTDEQVKEWQDQWLEMVHAGACCAAVIKDPHQEQKDKLIEEIQKEKNNQ